LDELRVEKPNLWKKKGATAVVLRQKEKGERGLQGKASSGGGKLLAL